MSITGGNDVVNFKIMIANSLCLFMRIIIIPLLAGMLLDDVLDLHHVIRECSIEHQ